MRLRPFADEDDAGGRHSSFLSLARTCSAAYEQLTSDASCWTTQRLRFDLNDSLFSTNDFPPRSRMGNEPARFVLLRSRFTARRQATLRRLLGATAYDSVVTPLTTRVETVALDDDPIVDRAADVERDAEGVARAAVYPDFHVSAGAAGAAAAGSACVRLCRGLAVRQLLLPAAAPLHSSGRLRHSERAPLASARQLPVPAAAAHIPEVQALSVEQPTRQPGSKGRGRVLLRQWDRLMAALPCTPSLSLLNVDVAWSGVIPFMTAMPPLGALRALTIDAGDNSPPNPDGHTERVLIQYPPPVEDAAAADSSATAAECELELELETDEELSFAQTWLRAALKRRAIAVIRSAVAARARRYYDTLEMLDDLERELSGLTAQQQHDILKTRGGAKRARHD